MKLKKAIKKIFFTLLTIFSLALIAFIIYFVRVALVDPPIPSNTSSTKLVRQQISENNYACGKSWLRKSESGLWEMYTEGDAFERGVMNGKLAKELTKIQEQSFVDQIKQLIPSTFYLHFLKYFIAWFNRDLAENVTEEYKLEIYGFSLSSPEEFDYIGSGYQRNLNYHAAHDIGHALQGMNMACTSFSVWDKKSSDSSLLVGRNFDFYAGDKFAENKIVWFCKPTNGYQFASVGWAGMIGVVSGMNEKGLTVTINASKSDMPSSSATPISLLAREILQYAKNINEAYIIAKKRKTFVSESIMIGSLEDNRTAIIEKSPEKIDLYNPKGNEIVCANHFQSKTFINDSVNINNIRESDSYFRFKRMEELVNQYDRLNKNDVAAILRNQKGLNNKNIGMGNEKALNQLIAHHAVIFNPAKKMMWVSANPFQIGRFIAYDLNKIFNKAAIHSNSEIYTQEQIISADTFLNSNAFVNFKKKKKMHHAIKACIRYNVQVELTDAKINCFIATNPQFYQTYLVLGDYFFNLKNLPKAKQYYNLCLEKEIPKLSEKREIIYKLLRCEK